MWTPPSYFICSSQTLTHNKPQQHCICTQMLKTEETLHQCVFDSMHFKHNVNHYYICLNLQTRFEFYYWKSCLRVLGRISHHWHQQFIHIQRQFIFTFMNHSSDESHSHAEWASYHSMLTNNVFFHLLKQTVRKTSAFSIQNNANLGWPSEIPNPFKYTYVRRHWKQNKTNRNTFS